MLDCYNLNISKEKLNSLFRGGYCEKKFSYFSYHIYSDNLEVTYFSKILLTNISNQNVNMNSCIYLKLCRNIWTWIMFVVLKKLIGLSLCDVGRLQCNFMPIKCNLTAPDIVECSTIRKAFCLSKVLCFDFFLFLFFTPRY